jgi:hypothetical protein
MRTYNDTFSPDELVEYVITHISVNSRIAIVTQYREGVYEYVHEKLNDHFNTVNVTLDVSTQTTFRWNLYNIEISFLSNSPLNFIGCAYTSVLLVDINNAKEIKESCVPTLDPVNGSLHNITIKG